MSPHLPHEMECARAAIAARLEAATSRKERLEWRKFLEDLEQEWAEKLSEMPLNAFQQGRWK